MAYRLAADLGERTERFALSGGGELVIGADPEGDVFLPSPLVSRRHARIDLGDGGPVLEDLGSTNGTFLEGSRVAEPVPIETGQVFQIGNVTAWLEEVEEGDLEPAVRLEHEEPGVEEAGADRQPAPTTASMGSLRALVVESLPALLDLLAHRAGGVRMAQAVGGALYGSLPCLGVDVEDVHVPGERGLVFTARREGLEEHAGHAVSAEAGRFSVRVAFTHPQQARGFRTLVASVARLIDLAEGQRTRPASQPTLSKPAFPEPPTVVPEVRRLYEQAARIALGDVSVLIQGESGTGKEVLARFIHEASPRRDGAFVALNCAALPRDLLEAELFGIEEKVATGVAPRPGKFEIADGGTLFLDEIADMAPETQARILRVLQEAEVYRIGSSGPRPARVRTLSATNRDIRKLLASGEFRSDLYHRIADWSVTLPPLRHRRPDVPNLAAYFLAQESERRGVRPTGISRAAVELLSSFPWPGNVRQLQREMARVALFLEDGDLLETRHLEPTIREGGGSAPRSLRERLATFEREEIQRALGEAAGDVTRAAEALGIGRSTLYRRMRELGIARQAETGSA